MLTASQRQALEWFAKGLLVHGPSPGWNADVELTCDGITMDGEDLKALFNLGLLAATAKPPPHAEYSDEDFGSITDDHEWAITDAGRAALARPPLSTTGRGTDG